MSLANTLYIHSFTK